MRVQYIPVEQYGFINIDRSFITPNKSRNMFAIRNRMFRLPFMGGQGGGKRVI